MLNPVPSSLEEAIEAELFNVFATFAGIHDSVREELELINQEYQNGYFSEQVFLESCQDAVRYLEKETGASIRDEHVVANFHLHGPSLEVLQAAQKLSPQMHISVLHDYPKSEPNGLSEHNVLITATRQDASTMLQVFGAYRFN